MCYSVLLLYIDGVVMVIIQMIPYLQYKLIIMSSKLNKITSDQIMIAMMHYDLVQLALIDEVLLDRVDQEDWFPSRVD